MTEHSAPPAVCRIIGLGTASPSYKIRQEDAAQFAVAMGVSRRHQKALLPLYRQSGVDQRYSVLLHSETGGYADRQDFYQASDEASLGGPTTSERMSAYQRYASELSMRAAGGAVRQAGIEVDQYTHLVTVSCSGFAAPGVDIDLVERLHLPRGIQRTHVGFMGCHGALNGIRVVKAICQSDPNAVVLMCAVELCSLHQQYTDNAQQLVANSLFSDGASALVCAGAEHAQKGARIGRIVDSGSYIIPDTSEMMSWKIGNHGFEMGLSPRVPDIITECLPDWMESWLNQHHLSCEEIDDWVIHPGGPRIVTACAEALQLSEQQVAPSFEILREYGNMSSATVLFVLQRFLARNSSRRRRVLLAFGPGLCIEAALLH